MVEIFVFVGFLVILGLLIAYFYMRDQTVTKQLGAYERAIDDLNNRLYELESGRAKEGEMDFKKALEEVEERLDDKLSELGDPLLRTIRAIKTMERNFESLEERITSRIEKIEESTKLTSMTNNSINANEERIIALYKEGKSLEKIAKKVRVPLGEVELILRIANLR